MATCFSIFPPPGSGWLDDKELAILSASIQWMPVNNEGICAFGMDLP
jgi:hypothetical protein